jgi:cytochrome c peroxidase
MLRTPDRAEWMLRIVLAAFIGLMVLDAGYIYAVEAGFWTDNELGTLRSLWIGSLEPLPVDPSNKYADNPNAAALGKKLFFDSRFSGNKKISCATCHREDYTFTDNLPLSHGLGTTDRRSMPLIGAAYSAWFFWDGRKDSLWAQALGPIENKVEHGISRTLSAFIISKYYREEYREIFGEYPDMTVETLPINARPAADDPMALKAWILMSPEQREQVNRIYVHMGKAIAAYVRTIFPEPTPFDKYVETLLSGKGAATNKILTNDEIAGLKLFIGKAQCTNCHNGPLFTNGDFHNIGLPGQDDSSADAGRSLGISQVLADEFNCLSRHSDASPRECYELRFIDTADQKYIGAFKTPTLRNVADRPPYMHAGQFATLEEVLDFYQTVADNPELGHRGLTDKELHQLAAFLRTLSGPLNSL